MKPLPTLASLALALTAPTVAQAQDPCVTTAELQWRASAFELRDDLIVEIASCLNLEDLEERADCLQEARDEYLEGLVLRQDQLDARLDLCGQLGGGLYDPDIDPSLFVDGIDNPYLPFPVGAVWNYEAQTEEGLEEVQVTVLAETREIEGVECVAVQDTVTLDGELVEDTIDWYAQDVDGNVWYFGEISFSYEDGYVESIEGSWLTGVDGAKPGIVMPAVANVGETYRQEWLLGEAEDAGTMLDDDVSVQLGIGTFNGCRQTADFTPIEPDALEHKFYAPGVGFIYETKPGETEVLELVSYSGV
jgi:hypothetical protein